MSNFQDDSYDDLDGYGDDFSPQPAIRPGLETLPDGSYEFEVLDAELTKSQNGNRICNLGLRANGGAVVQHTYWLNNQTKVNRMGYDFGVLGFEVSAPLSQTIPAAVRQLPGVKFRGVKTSRTYEGKLYHDLHVSVRTGGTPMPAGAEAAF